MCIRDSAERYTIERELGHGGMATVYLAQDLKHRRHVAIKVLRPELTAALGVERFLREIGIAARLQHPHILPLHDSGEAVGSLYYVMPYVEGESLRQRLVREMQLPLEDALQITSAVASALGYAHTHDVVHRDIKPENILLCGGEAVVADFGIARAITAAGGGKLTTTGVAVGTPAYMSPEQAAGETHLDGRSDVYSLGCVVYEMLAGHPPFLGASAQEVLARQTVDPVPPLHTARATVPRAVEQAIVKSLAKQPADRFAAAGEFSDALRVGGTPASPARWTSRRVVSVWGRWPVYAGIAVLGLLGGFAALSRSRARSGASRLAARPMLVVLPFENLGRPEDEYFADGMTEEVTARLAGLHGLGVIGRTSAIQYKQTKKTIPRIGQELGVDYVLEGTVRWDKVPHGASRVRVTPQLVRVSDASHVWAKVYDAVLADVFDVQSNIAAQVAETLDVTLFAPERQALAVIPTGNLEAYDYYLRGKDYELREFRREDAELAVQMYGRAVQLDSAFALAYDALAREQLTLSWVHGETGALAKARAALSRAQQLGPALAETHLALGYYYYTGSRDYGHALEQFEQVRQRKPNDPDVIRAIGLIRRRQGQWEQALRDLTRAGDLDPRNHAMFYELGLTYGLLLRRYAEAQRMVARAISLAPDVPAYHALGATLHLLENGDTSMAKDVLDRAGRMLDPARIMVERTRLAPNLVRVFATDYRDALAHITVQAAGGDSANYYLAKAAFYGVRSDSLAAHAYSDSARVVLEGQIATRTGSRSSEWLPLDSRLAIAYAALGRQADAVRLAREGVRIVPVSRDAFAGPITRVALAEVYIRTGEYDAAIDQLEYLLSIPAPMSAPLLRVDPLYAPLRGNPRFERLVQSRR